MSKQGSFVSQVQLIFKLWDIAIAIRAFVYAIGLGGGGMIGVIASTIEHLSVGGRIVIGLSAIVIFLAILWLVIYWIQRNRKPKVEFYDNRQWLNEKTGGFEREKEIAKQVWIATWAGQTLAMYPDKLKSTNIKRLALFNPEYNSLTEYAALLGEDLHTYQEAILKNTVNAINNGIPVWWVNRPMDGIVVVNPEKKDGMGQVRIESMPYCTGGNNLNIIVYEDEKRDLFNRLLEYIETLTKDTPITLDDVHRVRSRLYGNKDK